MFPLYFTLVLCPLEKGKLFMTAADFSLLQRWWIDDKFIFSNIDQKVESGWKLINEEVGKGLVCQSLPNSLPLSLLSSLPISLPLFCPLSVPIVPLYFSPNLSATVLMHFIANIVSQLVACQGELLPAVPYTGGGIWARGVPAEHDGRPALLESGLDRRLGKEGGWMLGGAAWAPVRTRAYLELYSQPFSITPNCFYL